MFFKNCNVFGYARQYFCVKHSSFIFCVITSEKNIIKISFYSQFTTHIKNKNQVFTFCKTIYLDEYCIPRWIYLDECLFKLVLQFWCLFTFLPFTTEFHLKYRLGIDFEWQLRKVESTNLIFKEVCQKKLVLHWIGLIGSFLHKNFNNFLMR